MILRRARPGEETALTDLVLRSKAYWGYDSDFIEACRSALSITTAGIETGRVMVAEGENGVIIGVCEIAPGSKSGSLEKLFIAPEAIGMGVGRALYEDAKAKLRGLGETQMTILSDPNAEAIYLKWGAKTLYRRPSEVFEGRDLPWMSAAL